MGRIECYCKDLKGVLNRVIIFVDIGKGVWKKLDYKQQEMDNKKRKGLGLLKTSNMSGSETQTLAYWVLGYTLVVFSKVESCPKILSDA